MTKYVLAKDLPFAKKGSKVYPSLVFAHDLCVTDNDNKERFVCYDDTCLVDDLISAGWIEEVKPRQWYIPENILRTYGSEVKPMLNLPYGEGVLKVTEALE